ADLLRDQDLVPAVQRAADALLARHSHEAGLLVRRWIGEKTDYAQV
ncbi:MAG: hypothetical protein RLZ44_1884, partial [Pseudomonadota bacterium]